MKHKITLLDFVARETFVKNLDADKTFLYLACLHHKYHYEVEPVVDSMSQQRQTDWLRKQMKMYFDLEIVDEDCIKKYKDRCSRRFDQQNLNLQEGGNTRNL